MLKPKCVTDMFDHKHGAGTAGSLPGVLPACQVGIGGSQQAQVSRARSFKTASETTRSPGLSGGAESTEFSHHRGGAEVAMQVRGSE